MSVPPIEQSIKQYLDTVRVGDRKLSARTYRTGLNHFTRYLQENDISPQSQVDQITPSMIISFAPWLEDYLTSTTDQGAVSRSTLRTYFASVLGWYAYCSIEAEWIDVPVEAYQRVRKRLYAMGRTEARVLAKRLPSDDVVNAVRNVVWGPVPEAATGRGHANSPTAQRKHQLAWLRNRAIVEVFLSTGIRVGELVRLRRSDILSGRREIEIQGKGKRHRIVFLSNRAWNSLQQYLKARDGETPLPNALLFSRHDAKAKDQVLPLNTRSVQRIFNHLAKLAGILNFALTPHTFRHYYATFMLQYADLAHVQDDLGHASPATTRIYAQVGIGQRRETHERIFDGGPEDPEAHIPFLQEEGLNSHTKLEKN